MGEMESRDRSCFDSCTMIGESKERRKKRGVEELGDEITVRF